VPTEVDVVVVGGGPSGSAAAHYLAARGHSVVVCERKTFPREKTCGDGLTPRAVKVLLDMGFEDELAGWERVVGLRVHAERRILEIPFPKLERWPDYGLVKPRKDLDEVVLDHAESFGAKVLFGTTVTEPVFDRGVVVGVKVKRDDGDEEIRSKFVIVGEGTATKFTRTLGRGRDPAYPMGFAIRQYFDSPYEHSGWFDAWLGVKSGVDSLPGYGWVFPVGDGTVNVGVGLLSTFERWREVNLHRLQSNFVSIIPPDFEINSHSVLSRKRAGRLFMGQSIWPPHGPGFILTGDAAGMINPCNGEGIAYAYETGRMAGRHIDEALRAGSSPSLESYTAEIERVYGPYYRLGRRFVKVIGHPKLMGFLVSNAMRSEALMSLTFTLLANLEDRRARSGQQKIFKAMNMIAEWKP
jgi:geranylgeranyl reductase family protein